MASTRKPGPVDRSIPNSDADASGIHPKPDAVDEPKLGPAQQPGDLGSLAHYRVLKKIGLGGMGIVYLGFDDALERKVALKMMLPKVAANAAARDRFLREAKASAKVSHPNIVAIYGVHEFNRVPFLAMQFLEGSPLDKYLLKKGPPTLSQILRVGRETADGLAAAHERGLVHRDIKPANLWLEAPHGHIKILDFGLAKPNGEDGGTELTQTGAVVGTPAYMAPEQARAEPVDPRTDLYSLGAVLYRLCTGRQPFTGPNVMAVLSALALDQPTPIRELNPAIPTVLADLIHKMLAKKPEDRPRTAAEVSAALKQIEKVQNGSGTQPLLPASAFETAPASGRGLMDIPAEMESAFANLETSVIAGPSKVTSASNLRVPKKKWPLWVPIAGTAAAVLAAITIVAVILSRGGKSQVNDEPTRRTPEKTKPVAVSTPNPETRRSTALPEKWFADVQAANADRQQEMIAEEMQKRNPRMLDELRFLLDGGKIAELELRPDVVTDLSPLAALKTLTKLTLKSRDSTTCELSDLTPLADLPLNSLTLFGLPKVKDLSALKKMPLAELTIQHAGVSDLTPLAGKTLKLLRCTHCPLAALAGLETCTIANLQLQATPVNDLTPVANCGVRELTIQADRVKDLSPLAGCPLESLAWEPPTFQWPVNYLQPLREKASLKEISRIPAADFWAIHDLRRSSGIAPLRAFKISEQELASAQFSADSAWLATAGKDGSVHIWNVKTWIESPAIKHTAALSRVEFVPDTDLILASSGSQILFWNVKTGAPDGAAIDASSPLTGVAVSPDGKRVFAACDSRILQWTLPERTPMEPVAGLGTAMTQSRFSRDGKLVAVAAEGRRLGLFDIGKQTFMYRNAPTLPGSSIVAAFAPDGHDVLHGDADGNLARVNWEANTEKPLARLLPLTRAVMHPKQPFAIAGGRDGWISVVNFDSGKLISQVNASALIKSIAVSPDGAWIVTAHADGSVRIWDSAVVMGTKSG